MYNFVSLHLRYKFSFGRYLLNSHSLKTLLTTLDESYCHSFPSLDLENVIVFSLVLSQAFPSTSWHLPFGVLYKGSSSLIEVVSSLTSQALVGFVVPSGLFSELLWFYILCSFPSFSKFLCNFGLSYFRSVPLFFHAIKEPQHSYIHNYFIVCGGRGDDVEKGNAS